MHEDDRYLTLHISGDITQLTSLELQIGSQSQVATLARLFCCAPKVRPQRKKKLTIYTTCTDDVTEFQVSFEHCTFFVFLLLGCVR